MKKLVLLAAATVSIILAKRKYDDGQAEQVLWAEATDPVEKA